MPKNSQQKRNVKLKELAASIRGVDLFCGVGGLTRGLEAAGISVGLGIDIDPACKYSYEKNNKASFLQKSVEEITSAELSGVFDDAAFKLLAGCPPCQPFSTYNHRWSRPADEPWNLLEHFSRLVKEACPQLVTMENVPPLEREDVFGDFVAVLDDEGFHVYHGIVNCADFGVPQQRQRLVLLASTLVLCRRDSFAKSLDFREDGIGRSRPHERVCVGVPFGRVAFDALDELRHLAERIAPNRLAGKDIEPDLHLIEPRSIGGGVVNVKSGTPCQPSLDLGLLMRGVVVDDEMNIEVSGDVGLDGAQELKELLVTMTGLALGHHFPGGYVQGGKSGWWCHGACNRA